MTEINFTRKSRFRRSCKLLPKKMRSEHYRIDKLPKQHWHKEVNPHMKGVA